MANGHDSLHVENIPLKNIPNPRVRSKSQVRGWYDPQDPLPKYPQDLKRSSRVIHQRKMVVTGRGKKESTIRLEKAKFSAKQWVEDGKSEKAESQPETCTSCRFGIVTQD